MTIQPEPHDEGYDGPARLTVADTVGLDVEVTLRGVFQPIDGHYHWYGRVERNQELDDAGGNGAAAHIRTPHGEAEGKLTDRDLWGRYRLSGIGRPPFPTD